MLRRRSLFALAIVALAAAPVSAEQGPPPPGPGPAHLAFVLQAIDLTPEQDSQIDPLMRARHQAADASRPAAKATGRALADQIRNGSFDEAAIRAKAAALAALDADRLVADAALLRDVRAILTPEQRAEFDRLLRPPRDSRSGGGPERERPHLEEDSL